MKTWWQSRTIWVNIITAVVGCVGVVAGSDLIEEYPSAAAVCAVIVGALNVILRIITDKPIAKKIV